MTKQTFLPGIPWLLILALPTHSAMATGSQPIVRLEHVWLTAAARHDRATLDRILASDFIDTNIHGETRDKAATMAHQGAPSGTTQVLRHLKVRRHGRMAVATGVNVVHSSTQGWTARVAFTDVFLRQRGYWRAISAQETLIREAPRKATHH